MSSLTSQFTQNPYTAFFLGTTVFFLVLWLMRAKPRKMSTNLGAQPFGVTTLCIDLRFQDEMQEYFEGYFGNNRFNNYAIPGVGLALLGSSSYNNAEATPAQTISSLSLIPGALASANYMTAWASTMYISRILHSVTRIAIMDHEDCGYYANYFDGTRDMSYAVPDGEGGFSTFTYAQGTSESNYNSLLGQRDKQMQVHSYYMEKSKYLWSQMLLPEIPTDSTSIGQAVGFNVPGVNFTGVQIHTFYIYKDGRIIETGSPLVCN